MYSLFKSFQKKSVFLVVSVFQNLFFSIEGPKLKKPVNQETFDIYKDINEFIYKIEKTVNENESFVEKVKSNIFYIDRVEYILQINNLAKQNPEFLVESQKINNKSLIKELFEAVDLSLNAKFGALEEIKSEEKNTILSKLKKTGEATKKVFQNLRKKKIETAYSVEINNNLGKFLKSLSEISLTEKQKIFEIHLLLSDTKKKIGELFNKHAESAYNLLCVHETTLKKIELIKLEAELLRNTENSQQEKISEKYCNLINEICDLELKYNSAIIRFQESEMKIRMFFGQKEDTLEINFAPRHPIFVDSTAMNLNFFTIPDDDQVNFETPTEKQIQELDQIKTEELYLWNQYLTHNRNMEKNVNQSTIKDCAVAICNIPKKASVSLSYSNNPNILHIIDKGTVSASANIVLTPGNLYSSFEAINNISYNSAKQSSDLNKKYLELFNKIIERQNKTNRLKKSMKNLLKNLNTNIKSYKMQKEKAKSTENIKRLIKIYELQSKVLIKKSEELSCLVCL